MEPKPESLWWTSTHQTEEKKVECGEHGPPIKDVFEVSGYRFHCDGKGGFKEQIERCAKAWPVGGETDTSTGQRV